MSTAGMATIDWTVARTAATGGLLLIVPGAILAGRLVDGQAGAGWIWAFVALALVGFAVAGFVAGRLRPDTPMLHGAVGASLAFVVAQVFGLAVTVARGGSISWIAVALTALLAVSMGVAGALVADRVHRRAVRLGHQA